MLANLLARLILNTVALLVIAYVVPGFHVASFYSALFAALILGLLNAVVKPILIILTLPITLVTLGLFVFVLNFMLFWFVSTIVKGFTIDNLLSAFIGWLLFSVFGIVFNKLQR